MQQEIIIVIERKDLLRQDRFCGIRVNTDLYIKRLNEHFFTASREESEKRTDWKQPIPYVMVTRGKKIFTTRRTKNSGEERLHGKLSVGIGGHMRPQGESSRSFSQLLKRNLYRELTEELNFLPELSIDDLNQCLTSIGILNDDRDEVGRCHFGLIYQLMVPETTEVAVRETDKLQGQFQHPDDIPLDPEITEGWSVICLKHLIENSDGGLTIAQQ